MESEELRQRREAAAVLASVRLRGAGARPSSDARLRREILDAFARQRAELDTYVERIQGEAADLRSLADGLNVEFLVLIRFLRGERDRASTRERGRELREDRQVGVEPNPIQPAHQ